ncbi:VWA domain-containing protein [Humisphaera borealis]|uniref:VWA domain-containing protein n=1 Tax=Humisphaera borealis TaxID=2807512 RepID=A0A7M2WXQ2_9BACT|nr:VWA domain-containing protein [Humisphaera borealis]QOV90134.1 VWA domain-containing protein [Humisphaera borealis]
MKYFYGEFDGEEFPTQDKLFGFDNLMDFILQYGDQALKALQQMMENPKDDAQSELLEQLLKDGILDKDGKGRLRLTPRAIGRMQRKALIEVFANLKQGQREGHEKVTPGSGGERIEGTKAYEFGDPVSELDLHATLSNAMKRATEARRQEGTKGHSPSSDAFVPGSPNAAGRPRAKIDFSEKDFELHLHEGVTSCSTVVLLDMSGSMMRYGRFLSAKKVAMAMQALVRQSFPQDSIDFVGFYSGAAKIPEIALPLAMPKPVTIYDYQVRLKVPIDQLDKAPQHFTNLHMGLQMARRILRKRASENKQIFIITDGQPTAHVEGDNVLLLYPPDPRSTAATLKEAVLAVRENCRIATFALIEDYWGMDWVGFVDQLARLTKGLAFYTSSGELANCIMESYLSGRKKKAHIA